MTNTKLSRRISYLLRHDPDMIDENGWADVSAVVWKMKGVFGPFDEELLEKIVAEDEKGRYSYNEDRTKIRANQGHSVPLAADAVGMVCLGPPEYLYHGTAQGFLPSILEEGLKPQSRNFVHLSGDMETAKKVGARHRRHGKAAVLRVDSGRMAADGRVFWLSANHVWQVGHVPPEYLTVVWRET